MVGPVRDADNRPFVKTRLKYEVTLEIDELVYGSPPKATEALSKRINKVQDDVIENVEDQIGDVILAAQNFSHPNRTKIIDREVEKYEPNNLVPQGKVHLRLIYVVDGTGIGEAAETRARLSDLADMERVLIDGDNTPIQKNQAIRDFDTGPIDIFSVYVSTD